VCSRICWRFLLNRRIKKKIQALAAIKEMLTILKSMGVLQKAVRSFKYRVIVGQRCISSFLAVARARLRVHQLQWAVMHLAWAKAVAERQAKLNKTKVSPIVSAIYQRLLGHYKSNGFRPPPGMVKRYCTFMRGSELFPLILDTNAEEVPCSTALLVQEQLKQGQKDTRKQYLARREVALAGNAKIKEQEKNLRIRMQARSLLCKMSVEEKMKYEDSVVQLQRTYAKAPAFPCSMLKSQLLKLMADYVAKADAVVASAASVTVKMEVVGD
jgi:DNA polymerase III delta prime subunit